MSNCLPPYFHKTTELNLDNVEHPEAVVMTVTNDTNVADLDCFELVLCQNPADVVPCEPLPFLVRINCENVELLNKYGLPINTNRLKQRKRYYGAYVEKNNNKKWVILFNTPTDARFAR